MASSSTHDSKEVDELKLKWESKQDQLKTKLIVEDTEPWQVPDDFNNLEYIGGMDLSFVKGDDCKACACLVVVEYPSLEVVYEDCQMVQLETPYIPGYLAFREAGFLVDLFVKLQKKCKEFLPQVILIDGNGMLHPKEFGIACHLGVLLNIPTIGVAKNLFRVDGLDKEKIAAQVQDLQHAGDPLPLVGNSGRILGKALQSTDKTSNPIYISIGHRISLDTAVKLVQKCCLFRIPEPIRQADMKSREYLRRELNS